MSVVGRSDSEIDSPDRLSPARNRKLSGRMAAANLWLVLILVMLTAVHGQHSHTPNVKRTKIQIGPDGGYSRIVVRIKESVREENCGLVISRLKTMLTEGSKVLHTALGGQVYLRQVSLVIPTAWSHAACSTHLDYPTGNTPFRTEDIVVTGEDGMLGDLPLTEQSGPCGTPGHRIRISQRFLTEDAHWTDDQPLEETTSSNSNTSSPEARPSNSRPRGWWGYPGKLFAKEWAKFRWGVFDEQGYPGDPLYPEFYQADGGRILPTGTSGSMVRGGWIFGNGTQACDPTVAAVTGEDGDRCYFKPEGPNDHIKCSLGYLPFLDSVGDWCSSRAEGGPTKHNILCEGKPAREVIMSHTDFTHRLSSAGNDRNSSRAEAGDAGSLRPIEFSVVREPRPEYVLIVDTSSHMAGVWKWLRKALQNLVRFDMADNSRVGVVTFNREARVEHDLASLTSERVRIRVADTLPDSAKQLSKYGERCITCAVQLAVEQLLKNKEAGGHLIIVSSQPELSTSDEDALAEYERYYSLRVSSVLMTDTAASDASSPTGQAYADLAAVSGGASIVSDAEVADNGGLSMLSGLIDSFRRVLSLDGTPVPIIVHSQRVKRERGSVSPTATATRGSFLLDSTLGLQTKFGVFVEDDEDHRIKWIKLIDSEGKVYGPYTKMSSDYDIINYKTINFGIGEQPPFKQAGQLWQYEIDWYTNQNSDHKGLVVVTSKERDPDVNSHLNVMAWTINEAIESTQPTVLYVKVSMGERPVLGASVAVIVGMASEDTAEAGLNQPDANRGQTFLLRDDGFGDPDLQSGDGIYSRYLTDRQYQQGQLADSSSMMLQIIVTDNNGTAYTTTAGVAATDLHQPVGISVPVCCGSVVPVPPHRREQLGVFFRRLAVEIPRKIQPQQEGGDDESSMMDKYPPAKIGDFTVIQHGDSVLEGEWSAVGGDYLDGQTSEYRILYTPNITALIVQPPVEEPPSPYISVLHPVEVGVRAGYNFTLPRGVHGVYYLAVQAFDKAGNLGRMSNLVRLDLGEPSGDNGGLGDGETGDGAEGGPNGADAMTELLNSPVIVGIVLGVVGFILVLLVSICVCLLCGRGRRKRGTAQRSASKRKITGGSGSSGKIKIRTRSSGVNVHIPSPTRSNSTDVSYESEHQLVVGPSTLPINGGGGSHLGGGGNRPSSTSFANNITPTYWSASQLLSEHESRVSKSLERNKNNNSNHYRYGGANGLGYSDQPRAGMMSPTKDGSVYDGYTITPMYNDEIYAGGYNVGGSEKLAGEFGGFTGAGYGGFENGLKPSLHNVATYNMADDGFQPSPYAYSGLTRPDYGIIIKHPVGGSPGGENIYGEAGDDSSSSPRRPFVADLGVGGTAATGQKGGGGNDYAPCPMVNIYGRSPVDEVEGGPDLIMDGEDPSATEDDDETAVNRNRAVVNVSDISSAAIYAGATGLNNINSSLRGSNLSLNSAKNRRNMTQV